MLVSSCLSRKASVSVYNKRWAVASFGINLRTYFYSVLYYKNRSWMWGWDKGICPEDHRLASRGLPSDDKRWSRGTEFLFHPHTNNGFLFLLTTKYRISYWKSMKRLPENPEYAEMRHGDIILTFKWRHGSTCDQLAVDVRLFIFFPSLVFSGNRKIPTRGPTIPVGNETCRVSHWTVDPRVGIFQEPLNTNDRFFFSYTTTVRYSTV